MFKDIIAICPWYPEKTHYNYCRRKEQDAQLKAQVIGAFGSLARSWTELTFNSRLRSNEAQRNAYPHRHRHHRVVRPGEQAGGLRLPDRLFPALRERTGAALEYSRGITNVGSPWFTNTDVFASASK